MLRFLFISFLLISLNLLSYAQDSVSVNLKVTVPQSTPKDATIYWAGSLNNWEPGNNFIPNSSPKSLRKGQGSMQITLKAPKDDSVSYKYTRGSMFSVEEQDDFTYRPLRTVVFNQSKTIRDTVAAWHDRPPKGLSSQWPEVTLKPTKQIINYYGTIREGSAYILYDKARGSNFTDMSSYDTKINDIPDDISRHVSYFLKLSQAKDNTILVMAGKKTHSKFWTVFVDQNNDNSIDAREKVFTVRSDTSQNRWNGPVHFQRMTDGKSVDDSVNFGLQHAVDLPSQHRSTDAKGAPDLAYSLPFKQRQATIDGKNFYLITPFTQQFSQFFYLAVDQNHNDTLSINSGSNEVSTISLNQMYQTQKFYILPKFKLGKNHWEVVDVNSKDSSIRLRPARSFQAKANISPGEATPEWHATTISRKRIGSKSLHGNYVLLNFWGSWCGGCVQEIPTLKKAYEKFNSENFTIIGFDYGDNRNMLNKALKKYELPWPQVFDRKGKYKTKFSVFGFPTNYLIGPDGKVLATGSDLWSGKLISTIGKYLK